MSNVFTFIEVEAALNPFMHLTLPLIKKMAKHTLKICIAPQNYQSMFGYISALCMNRLKSRIW